MKELKGKDINEVIAEGSSKLASMPSGVCDRFAAYECHVTDETFAGGAVAAGGGGAAAGGEETKAEEKKEEAAKEESEESDDDMGFGLFD